MTAQEARQTALKYNTSNENSQYAEIKALIASASKKGKYTAAYYKSVHPDVLSKLKTEGYKVDCYPGDQRDGPYIVIAW